MTRLHKRCQLIGIGIFITLFTVFNFSTSQAQCDFISNITGITQSSPPTGDAANPMLFTHTFVLVDNLGNIYATSNTPDFTGVLAGFYNLYAVNYDNNESAAVGPLLAIGNAWSALKNYGDNSNNCLDYSTAYGSGCPIVVCEELTVCEYETISSPSSGFVTTGHGQTYCIVCAGNVVAVNTLANFDLSAISAVTGGADCQLFAINYELTGGITLGIGDAWSTVSSAVCAASTNCLDYIGLDLTIEGLSQASTNGVSTTVDWWDTSDGCAGAQEPVNAGAPFSQTVNNWCIPSYNPSGIVARPNAPNNPLSTDDLAQLMGAQQLFSRVPCVGTMDLTQNTVFYTVQCDPLLPSTLEVEVTNPGGGITRVEAALYGPVTIPCPTITGGTFVDCDDAGAGSQSGSAIRNLTLTTDAGPGEVYLVIVDTEGKEEFTISTTILLATELVSFTGHKAADDNVLEWSTAQEENLKHFELERSNNGVNFEKITNVLAIGNAKTNQDYSYVDKYPGVGTKYYRLKSIHQDGTVSYSHIVTLSRDQKEHFTNINIYPNPTKDNFFVEFASDVIATIDYEIRDVIGQNAKKGELDVIAGMNKLELSLDNMPSATYIVSFTVEGQQLQRRIVKK